MRKPPNDQREPATPGRGSGWIGGISGHLVARVALASILLAAVVAAAGHNQGLVRTPFGARKAAVTANRSSPSSTLAPSAARRRAVPPSSSPSTSAPAAPAVTSMADLREPDAIVTLPESASPTLVKTVQALKDVQAAEVVDTGTVQVQGGPAVTIGVDPGTFRNFTPKITASSDQLWQYVAKGTLASSFEMARDRNLSLGASVAVVAANGAPLAAPQWLGAFMSVGLPGIDLVVSRALRAPLKLRADSGLVVSAPTADPFVLQTAIKKLVPGAAVVLMRPGLALGAPGGSFLNQAQISTVLTSALSRLGKPYVWGATGPTGFDCSGLIGWSFAAAGISLPRTAAEQALSGPRVAFNQIQPGDLLFWAYDPANPTFIDHVALYLGNGNMVEAPQTGQQVHIVKVVTGHLAGAVRINPAISGRLGGPWLK